MSDLPKDAKSYIKEVPRTLWLQWNGNGIADGVAEVSEGDVTWCRDRIFDGDIEYVHAGELRRALRGHRSSELWGDKGLIAAYVTYLLSPTRHARMQSRIAAGRGFVQPPQLSSG